MAYVLLFALSVPWYLPAATPVPMWLGLPYWVVIAIAGSTAIAVFTAFVVASFWPTEGGLEHRQRRGGEASHGPGRGERS